jgi:uncharacterized membrane protein
MDNSTPPPSPNPTPAQPVAVAQDKTVAVISYLTLIGFIVAVVLYTSKKTELGAFHLRQTLGLLLTAMAVIICEFLLLFIPVIGWLCVFALWVALFALWIMGLIAAVKGEMKPVPVIGRLYQEWFANVFN